MLNRSWMGAALLALAACGGGAQADLVGAPAQDGGQDVPEAAQDSDASDGAAPVEGGLPDAGSKGGALDGGDADAVPGDSAAPPSGEPCDADVCHVNGPMALGCTNADHFGCTPDPNAPLGTCPGTPNNCLGAPTRAYRCTMPPPSPELIPGCMAPSRGSMPDEWCCEYTDNGNGDIRTPFCPTDGGSWSPYSPGNCP